MAMNLIDVDNDSCISDIGEMETDASATASSIASSSTSSMYSLIDLSYKDLEQIPPNYTNETSSFSPSYVRSLQLQHNHLVTVPDDIRTFSNLTSIDLSHNGIAVLPPAIGQLSTLRVLSLANNNLESWSFPKEFVNLKRLEALNVGGNRIDEFPSCFIELEKLQSLYFGANRLRELPYKIGLLKELQIIYLGGNRLTEIPATIGLLRKLTSLVLCDNRLETIPSTIADLHRLESLSLHNNKLTTLPPAIIKLRRLHQLSLRLNPLVARFARDMTFEPASLRELAGRVVKLDDRLTWAIPLLPREVMGYLHSANECVNPKCRGVYFEACVEHIKFVDFCGKFRVPLLQYLCSPKCRRSPAFRNHNISTTTDTSDETEYSDSEFTNDDEHRIKKVLLG